MMRRGREEGVGVGVGGVEEDGGGHRIQNELRH
jgi:hypothetical protein